MTPNGDRDVEKGQSSPAGGVVSASPSVDSVGLFNFGRTPAQVSPCHYYSTAVYDSHEELFVKSSVSFLAL